MTQKSMMEFFGMDKYAFNARLKPAFLTILPVMLIAILHYPTVWIQASALLALITTCGVIYWLAQLSRQKGRDIEQRLGVRVGRAHTAQLLAHSDKALPSQIKDSVRNLVSENSGIVMPTLLEEEVSPDDSQNSRLSAVIWLLEHTRPKAKETLLHDDNIAYGFRRNLLGLKQIGVSIAVACAAINPMIVLSKPSPIENFPVYVFLQIALFACCAIWLFSITEKFVEDASLAYAQRLFSICLKT